MSVASAGAVGAGQPFCSSNAGDGLDGFVPRITITNLAYRRSEELLGD